MQDSPSDSVPAARKAEAETIALAAMRGAAMLMESGARARVVYEFAEIAVRAMGGTFGGFRLGYASMNITVGREGQLVSSMANFHAPGVNHRMSEAVKALALAAEKNGMDAVAFSSGLDRIKKETGRHPPLCVALAVGLACAAFAMLLQGDAVTFAAVFAAATLAQHLRHVLRRHGMNLYVITALVALAGSFLGGFFAQEAGSATVDMALIAPTLLLVPGVPATNAQTDIIDGYPTLGSARAVAVLMVMVFATTGIWVASFMLGLTR